MAETVSQKTDLAEERRKPVRKSLQVECRKGSLGMGPNLLLAAVNLCETSMTVVLKALLDEGQEVEVAISGSGIGGSIRRIARVSSVRFRGLSFCSRLSFLSPLSYADVQQMIRPRMLR